MPDDKKPSSKYTAISTGIGKDKVALTPGSEGAEPTQLGWNGGIKSSPGIQAVPYGQLPYPVAGVSSTNHAQQKKTPKKKSVLGEMKYAYGAPLTGAELESAAALDTFPYLGSPNPEPIPWPDGVKVTLVKDGSVVAGDAYTPDPPYTPSAIPEAVEKGPDYLDDIIGGRRQVDALEL